MPNARASAPMIVNGSQNARVPWLGALAIILLTFIAYLPALQAGYIWDDDDYLTNNTNLNDRLSGLVALWTPGTTRQYYPVVFTTFWIEHQLWGLNPVGYHIVNVLLHALNGVLVWRLAMRLKIARGTAWMIAAVFALHPVHVESVAWITERKNTLSALFYLLAALAYLRFHDEKPRPEAREAASGVARPWAMYAASLALFVLALLSKSVTCSLPVALMLMMLWQGKRLTLPRLAPLIPFFIIGLLLALHTAHLEKEHVGATGAEFAFTFADRVLIASRALLFYPQKALAPWPLMFIYPRWTIDPSNALQWLPVAAIVGIAALCLWLYVRGRRGLPLALAFYAATIFPALGFFNIYPMRYSFVADHFQYLASLGIIAPAVAIVATALRSDAIRLTIAAMVLLALGALTFERCQAYHDEETLWRATIGQNPGAWIAWNNLGGILSKRGEIDAAVAALEEGVRIHPTDQTIAHNLAVAVRDAGRAADRAGRIGDADRLYRRGITLPEFDPDTLMLQGDFLIRQKRWGEASASIERYIAMRPVDAYALQILGDALAGAGHCAEAQHRYRAAIERAANTDDRIAGQVRLIRALATCGDEHLRDTNGAIQLGESLTSAANPDPNLLGALAEAYAGAGRWMDAAAAAERGAARAAELGQSARQAEMRNQAEAYRAGRAPAR